MIPKMVLMLLASKFQFKVWQAALTSQDISVIGGSSNVQVSRILEELKVAQIGLPDLLLIDFDIDNPYDVCRWCRLYYPSLKIILISTNQKVISSTERRWAIYQGADDLMVGFKQQNLLSDVIAQVTRVLNILDCPPLREIALVPALLDFCKDADVTASSSEAEAFLGLNQEEDDSLSRQIILLEQESSINTDKNRKLQSSLVKKDGRIPLSIKLLFTLVLLASFLLFVARTKFDTRSNQISSSTKSNQEIKSTNTFKEVTGVPNGIFSYDGSTTWVPILKIVNPQIHQAYPQLKLRYSFPLGDKPGSSTGIKRLLEGQIDFAISSRPLKPEEYTQAERQGFRLSQHQIGIDGVVIATNYSLPINGISIKSLEQIYLGKLTNWNQLGGPNLKIVPVSRRPEASGTVDFFQSTVLNQQNFSSEVNYVDSTTEALRKISSIPNGIYYGSASEIVPQCTVKSLSVGLTEDNLIAPYQGKMITPTECPQQRNKINQQAFANGSYPITRNLFVIVKDNGERQEKIGNAFVKLLLSKEGQKIVEKAGFVPLE